MSEPKISVIVPVYGVERWLDRCVASIVGQTYRNLEIVLVDDGSPDGCPALCDQWAERDSRVRVLHRPNGGQSAARNSGLEAATGQYVTFCDSDDWIAPDTYEHLLCLLQTYDADIAQIGCMLAYHDTDRPQQREEHIEVVAGREQILQHYMTTTTTTGSYSVCRCLFPLAAVRALRFREGRVVEDMDWKYQALSAARRFVVSDKEMYFYFQSGSSTSSGAIKPKDFDLYEGASVLAALCARETYGTIAQLGRVKVARTPFSLLSRLALDGCTPAIADPRALRRRLQRELRGGVWTLLRSPMRTDRKVVAALFCLSYHLTALLLRAVRRVKQR